MSAHVAVEVTRLREASIADLTLVRFFSGVGAVVLGEGGAVREALAACVTLIGAIAGVRAQVRGDGGALREPALADRAFKRLFAAVGTQMGREVSRLGKGFLADGTLVRFFSVVRAQVRLQRGLARVSLAADMARVGSREGVPNRRSHSGAAGEVDGRRRRGVVERAVRLLRVRGRVEGAGYSTHWRVGVRRVH